MADTYSNIANMTQEQVRGMIEQQYQQRLAQGMPERTLEYNYQTPNESYYIPGIGDVTYKPYEDTIYAAEATGPTASNGGTPQTLYQPNAQGGFTPIQEVYNPTGSNWLSKNFTNLVKGGIAVLGAMALGPVIGEIAGLTAAETAPAFAATDAAAMAAAGATPAEIATVIGEAYGSAQLGTVAAELAATGATASEIAAAIPQMIVTGTAGGVGAGTVAALAGGTAAAAGLLNTSGAAVSPSAPVETVPPEQVMEITGQAPSSPVVPAAAALAGTGLLANTVAEPTLPANQVMEITAPAKTPPVDSLTTLTPAQTAALAAGAGGLVSNAVETPADGLSGSDIAKAAAGLLTGGADLGLSASAAQNLKDTFATQASSITDAAQANAPGYQFSPVGITTRFGSATPKFDANGKLIGYDYGATGDIAAQRDQLLKLSQQALPTTTDPTQIAQNYIAQQQGLLAPGQQQDLAALQAQMAATGRAGLSTGATTGAGGGVALAATNPQLAAYYNSLAQQNAQLGANAPTYAQNLLNSQIGTSGTLFGQAQGLEAAAQQPMQLGTNLGTAITAGTTNASNAAQQAALQSAALQSEGALRAQGINTTAQQSLLSGLSGNQGFQNLLSTGFNWLTGK